MSDETSITSEAAATITAIAPWFGGKRTLAPTIVRELGKHRAYWEPFCGSLAVTLTKPPASHETVNDLHGDVTNLARVIASPLAPELHDRLQRTLMAEGIYDVCCRIIRAGDPPACQTMADIGPEHVERAYAFFVMSWMGRNGCSGTLRQTYQMVKRWTPGGGSGSVRFRSAVDSLPAWHERLRNVEILTMDGFVLLDRIADVEGVAIYLDPPYLQQGGRSSSTLYKHEFTAADHRRLAELAGRFRRARVVVSYYDDPMLDQLYPAPLWTKVNCYRQKNLHLQNRRESEATTAPEVLLVTGPSTTDSGGEA